MTKSSLKIAVVVGYHSFEFQPFQEMFEAMPEFHCYIQHLEQFTSSTKEIRESYDVIVFYTMCLNTPVNNGPWYEGAALDALSALGETKQGIVILHHSILAFQNWPLWTNLTGLDPKKYHDYHLEVPMSFHVTAPNHPIMNGVSDFNPVTAIPLIPMNHFAKFFGMVFSGLPINYNKSIFLNIRRISIWHIKQSLLVPVPGEHGGVSTFSRQTSWMVQ